MLSGSDFAWRRGGGRSILVRWGLGLFLARGMGFGGGLIVGVLGRRPGGWSIIVRNGSLLLFRRAGGIRVVGVRLPGRCGGGWSFIIRRRLRLFLPRRVGFGGVDLSSDLLPVVSCGPSAFGDHRRPNQANDAAAKESVHRQPSHRPRNTSRFQLKTYWVLRIGILPDRALSPLLPRARAGLPL